MYIWSNFKICSIIEKKTFVVPARELIRWLMATVIAIGSLECTEAEASKPRRQH